MSIVTASKQLSAIAGSAPIDPSTPWRARCGTAALVAFARGWPQELGVLAALAFESLNHAVALEQICIHNPQATGASSRALMTIELARDGIGGTPAQDPPRLIASHPADRIMRQNQLGPRAGQSNRLPQGPIADERIRVGDLLDWLDPKMVRFGCGTVCSPTARKSCLTPSYRWPIRCCKLTSPSLYRGSVRDLAALPWTYPGWVEQTRRLPMHLQPSFPPLVTRTQSPSPRTSHCRAFIWYTTL
jgi:hypothetical protein